MKTVKMNRRKAALSSVHEIEIVYKRPLYDEAKKITSSQDAERIFRMLIDPRKVDLKEFFCVMLLSMAHQVLGIAEIGIGGVNGVVVNIPEIFQLALCTNATGIILCHNHPSGNLNPSKRDIDMTKTIRQGAKLFDMKVLDHIIITSEGYYSFTDEGLL